MDHLLKENILPERDLPYGKDLLAEGRKLQSTWSYRPNLFHRENHVTNEIEYKLNAIKNGRIMQHAHLGYRSLDHSCEAQFMIPVWIKAQK